MDKIHFDLKEDHFLGCRIYSTVNNYQSRLYDHKKILYEKIVILLREDNITLRNAIFLLEKLYRSSIPNLPLEKLKGRTDILIVDEINFLDEFLQTLYDYMDLEEALLIGLPCATNYVDENEPWGCQIFYLDIETNCPIKTKLFDSKQEAIEWLDEEGRIKIPYVKKRRDLRDQILSFIDGPMYSIEYIQRN